MLSLGHRIARSSSVVSFWRGDLSAFANKLAAFSARTSAGHNGSFLKRSRSWCGYAL